jgi:hypothetical protein
MALTSYFVNPVTSGAANTKGAYAAFVASTPYDCSRLFLMVRGTAAANRFFLFDLAIGAAGAETVVVANIAVGDGADFVIGAFVEINVDIPMGSRVSMRCQSVTASTVAAVALMLENRALGALTAPVTYGANTAASRGTQIDPGAVISTKGAYVEFSASTTARIDAVMLCATVNAQAAAIASGTVWSVDVATGGSGSETVVIPNLLYIANSPDDKVSPGLIRIPVSIPAATRLAVRCDCNRNTATERLLCLTVIGMQEPAASGGGQRSVAYLG